MACSKCWPYDCSSPSLALWLCVFPARYTPSSRTRVPTTEVQWISIRLSSPMRTCVGMLRSICHLLLVVRTLTCIRGPSPTHTTSACLARWLGSARMFPSLRSGVLSRAGSLISLRRRTEVGTRRIHQCLFLHRQHVVSGHGDPPPGAAPRPRSAPKL